MEETIIPNTTQELAPDVTPTTEVTTRTETVSRIRHGSVKTPGAPRIRHADGTFMDADARDFFLDLVEKNWAALAPLFPTETPAPAVTWTTKEVRDAKAQEIVRSLWNAGLDMGGTYHFARTKDQGNNFARCDNGVEVHVFTNTVRLWVPKPVADADAVTRCALALSASSRTVSTYKSGTKVLLTF